MDVSIFVETTFDDGETKRRVIGRLRRAPDEFCSENLGLLLDDAKSLLRLLQEAIVQDQVGGAIEVAGNAMAVANTERSMTIEAVYSTLLSGEFG
jgi:hypothetical protein